MSEFSTAELEAFLDEALPVARMAEVEDAMRDSQALCARLAAINERRDRGEHSLGEIWRSENVSCPTRQQLGSYLLGARPDEMHGYVRFHLEVIQCRFCAANLQDLQDQQVQSDSVSTEARRRRYFQSSAGYLRKDE